MFDKTQGFALPVQARLFVYDWYGIFLLLQDHLRCNQNSQRQALFEKQVFNRA